MMHTDRINFLDVQFDRQAFSDVKARLQAVTSETPYAYVVTPNVDHLVRLRAEPELRELYEEADLCVCDSRILLLLARLRGIRMPLVPGSDLCAALFSDVIGPNDRIAIVGSDRACVDQLRARFPETHFLHFEPPMGLRHSPDARRAAAEFVASSKARFAFIAVGSPQQELIAREIRAHPGAHGTALCIGAGLDFIVGKQKRAPKFLQKLGLEWAHRLATSPRRLWRRYLVDDIRILPIWLEWKAPGNRGSWTITILAVAILAVAGCTIVAALLAHNSRTSPVLTSKLPPLSSASVAAIQALPAPNLLKPLSSQQAVTENGERPFAGRPDSAASHFVLHTDADDRARALTCLAQAIYYEAAGEGTDGERAVAQVVLNRVRHPGFPSTICGVVYEGSDRPTGCQFSFTCNGALEHIPAPSLWTQSKKVAEDALKGHVFGAIGHATHYHAEYVLPYWADSLDKSVQIGRHIFYRLRYSFGEARAFSQHYGGAEPPFRTPGTIIGGAQTAESQQLANALIGDDAMAATKHLDKASPMPGSPLVADSNRGILIADGGSTAERAKSKAQCPAGLNRSQASTLRVDEARPASAPLNC